MRIMNYVFLECNNNFFLIIVVLVFINCLHAIVNNKIPQTQNTLYTVNSYDLSIFDLRYLYRPHLTCVPNENFVL